MLRAAEEGTRRENNTSCSQPIARATWEKTQRKIYLHISLADTDAIAYLGDLEPSGSS